MQTVLVRAMMIESWNKIMKMKWRIMMILMNLNIIVKRVKKMKKLMMKMSKLITFLMMQTNT